MLTTENRVLDGIGVYGEVFQYSMAFALIGSAILVFIYLWYKGKLSMDEQAKMEMYGMDEEHPIEKHEEEEKLRVGDYAHHEIQEYQNTRVPAFLKCLYFLLPIWGLCSLYYFWDGSRGWMDRGFWHELEIAAKTTSVSSAISEEPANPPLKRLKDLKKGAGHDSKF